MYKNKIFYRADGNTQIGWGHITRSMVLAGILQNHFENIFVTRFLDNHIENQIKNVCSSIIKLDNTEKHFDEFLTHLHKDDIVVLDNYFFTTNDQERIKSIGCKLVVIDDMHDKHFVSDLVINHSYGVIPSDYSKEGYTQLLLGFDYALIRPSFYTEHPKKQTTDNFDCFICLGGSTYGESTNSFVEMALKHPEVASVRAVVGGSKDIYQKLKSSFSENDKVTIYYNLTEHEMVSAMDSCNCAIVPSSGLLLESLSRGLKVMTGYFVDNQTLLYQALLKDNLIVGLGNLNYSESLPETILKGFEALNDIDSKLDFSRSPRNLLDSFMKL